MKILHRTLGLSIWLSWTLFSLSAEALPTVQPMFKRSTYMIVSDKCVDATTGASVDCPKMCIDEKGRSVKCPDEPLTVAEILGIVFLAICLTILLLICFKGCFDDWPKRKPRSTIPKVAPISNRGNGIHFSFTSKASPTTTRYGGWRFPFTSKASPSTPTSRRGLRFGRTSTITRPEPSHVRDVWDVGSVSDSSTLVGR